MQRLAAVSALLLVSLAATAPVSAHNWNACNAGVNSRWAGTSTTHGYDLNWAASTRAAIDAAAASVNTTDFDYVRVGWSQASMPWQPLGSPDTSVAGATYISVNCSTHRINAGTLYINFSHVVAFGDSQDQKQCIAAHEFFHGMGFDHNSLVSVLLGDHWTRCHTNLIKTVQPHDTSDANARY